MIIIKIDHIFMEFWLTLYSFSKSKLIMQYWWLNIEKINT